jgi:trans-2-enoyl-CoA reductase
MFLVSIDVTQCLSLSHVIVIMCRIRTAYKDKAMSSHPDRGGSPETWAAIQKAFDTLSDLQRRALYDRTKHDEQGGAEKQFQAKFGEGAFDLSDAGAAGSGRGRKGGLNILQQMAEVKKDEERMRESNKTAVIQTGYEMSHSAGFDAWMRNREGLGTTGTFTSDDLIRQSKMYGGVLGGGGDPLIEATDSTSQPLPPLTATSVRFEHHGAPEEVLYVDKAHPMPEKLQHGEVLVYMLAACVNDEDLLRVQTPLTILNDFPPFNRTKNKWEEISLPATAGVEGVGIVLAAAKNIGRPDAADKAVMNLPGFNPPKEEDIFEVKDWVIALPDARAKPIGCWSTLAVCDSSRLLKVPAQMLPTQHYACSRSLCTAYRLLEDFGNLRPGDTIIQNCADLPVGQAVIQLCNMLKIRSINLVTDDDGFERTKELLMQLGSTHVLRDNSKLSEFLDALGSEMPRLALDSLGGEAGKRLAIALRPGGTLVMHQMQSGQVPQISPSLLMYQQISMYGFNLSQWTTENGKEAYLQMLRTLAELVSAERLNVFTRAVRVDGLTQETLQAAIKSHRQVQDAKTFRERTVLVLGDETSANDMYFELAAQIRKMEAGEDPDFDFGSLAMGGGGGGGRAAVSTVPGSAGFRASARWADAQAMLRELQLEQYIPQFEEEEMTSTSLLEEIVTRADGEKELMEALKEMGIKKMGHRQSIVGAVVGRL